MKHKILAIFLLTCLTACQEDKQKEEEMDAHDFFLKRSEKAKSIKAQNFSVSPGSTSQWQKQQIQEEQEKLPEDVLEGIIPESQEERPATDPSVNGDSETQYMEFKEEQHERHLDGSD